LVNQVRFLEAERQLWDWIGVTPIERTVHLARNDVDVRVREIGEGPPVLFVHGGTTSGMSWATLAARLGGFRCLMFDRPGTGVSEPLSAKLDVESLPRLGESLIVDVLDALDLESAHLVATSLGGYLALHTCAARPERVPRMVQFSWPMGAPNPKLPAFFRMSAVPGVAWVMGVVPPNNRSIRTLFGLLGHGPSLADGRIAQVELDAYLALLRDTDTMRNEMAAPRAIMNLPGRLHRHLLADDLVSSITTPTLFLWGENDPFGGEAVARRLVDLMPNAVLEMLPDAGHAPWLDELDYCAKATARFLSG
jgi:pimeloyl-ACP methyl ester carboxylesterase